MELQNLKEQMNKAGFSEEVLASLNLILDAAIASGNLSEEDRGKMDEIVNKEIEQSKMQAAVMEEIAFGLEEYAGELDLAAKIADKKLDSLEENINSEIDDLEEEVKQATTPNNPPEAAPATQ